MAGKPARSMSRASNGLNAPGATRTSPDPSASRSRRPGDVWVGMGISDPGADLQAVPVGGVAAEERLGELRVDPAHGILRSQDVPRRVVAGVHLLAGHINRLPEARLFRLIGGSFRAVGDVAHI